MDVFGSSKKPTADSLNYGKVETVIGEGTEIKGTFESSGVVRIDGYLEGTIHHSGDLIVGPKGRIVANVRSKGLAMSGEVRGEIEVEGKLELLPGARLHGDVKCGHLIVHEGALFHGRSNMTTGNDSAVRNTGGAQDDK